MRDLFAAWAPASPVTAPGNSGNSGVPGRCYREISYEINVVTAVTAVTAENGSQPYAPDDADRMDAYEERAAILEYEGRLSRSEAERRAWLEVFGNHGE